MFFFAALDGNSRRQEDVYLHRRTARIKLSKYAAYNTYHHCEQCHQYMGFNPQYQVSHNNVYYTVLLNTWIWPVYGSTEILIHRQIYIIMCVFWSDCILDRWLSVCSCTSPPCMPLHSLTFYWERKSSSTSSFPNPRSITSPSANQEAS